MGKYDIIIKSDIAIENPLHSYYNSYWKDKISYSYSGPIEGCTILNEIYACSVYYKYKFYNYNQVMDILSKFDIVPVNIYIVKYDFNFHKKINWVITFNNQNYVWTRKCNNTEKGGKNHITSYYDNMYEDYLVHKIMVKYSDSKVSLPDSFEGLLRNL